MMIEQKPFLAVAWAEALFASDVATYSRPTRDEVSTAVRNAVRAYGGVRGCAGEVAAAYGERPETAAPRMRWALQIVGSVGIRPTVGARKTPHRRHSASPVKPYAING
jgi:hypothetical protein